MDEKEKAWNKFVDKIIDAIETRMAKKPHAGFSEAKVLRVDGNTVWLHIPGGADETPAKKTIDCKKGDTVQIRNGGGVAVLVGNQTAPPTDDSKANKVSVAEEKTEKRVGIVEEAAEALKKTTKGIMQYFWVKDGSGDEAGAHVTEVPRNEFEDNPSGGNLLMRSNSVRIRMGTLVLSELSANRMTMASGKAVVKYSEDGSAFGLQDSHRIVVCKGTDEAGVRNDATLSSRDVAGFDIDSTPMAFFNASHKVDNDVKYYAASAYAFDGEGRFWALVLGKDGLLQNTGGFSIWAPGGIKKFDLDGYDALWTLAGDNADKIAAMQDDIAVLPSTFAVETYTLTMSTSALAAGGHLEYAEVKTKAGYYPLSIAGFHSNKQATTVRSCYLTDCDEGTCNIHIQIRNDSGSSASANITADVMVLWVKYGA